jgi:hypothetical protein
VYDEVSPKYPAGQLQPLDESRELPARQGLMTDARGSLQVLHEEHAADPVAKGLSYRNFISRCGNLALTPTQFTPMLKPVIDAFKKHEDESECTDATLPRIV